jgi:hypothetical protein
VSQRPRPCRYCGVPIVFALTRTTARRPFDAKPMRMFRLSFSEWNTQAHELEVYALHECPAKESA